MKTFTRTTELDIEASPEAIWRAITDPDLTQQYYFGARNSSAWEPGARWVSESPEGELYLEGQVLEADAPRRLVQTFHVVHEPEAAADPPSRMIWAIEDRGGTSHLVVTHDEMGEATRRYSDGGEEFILAGLKALVERGRTTSEAVASATVAA